MRTTTIVAFLSVVALGVDASLNHENLHRPNHKRGALAARSTEKMVKRCKVKGGEKTPTPPKPAENVKDPAKPSKDNGDKKGGSKDEPEAPPKAPASNNGLMRVTSPQCGASKAVAKSSKTSGPNGDIHWLTCGVTGGGWNPPNVKISDLRTANLASAVNGGLFSACKQYVGLFTSAANKYGLPPILLASIAMQESSCNAKTVGGNGEQGLMQITADKCPGGHGGSACMNPEYNINRGAKYFKDTLDSNNGNVLLTMGSYNGYFKGMTTGSVAEMKKKYGCQAQQNLDYLHQVFNGYLLNVDPYSLNMGAFFNLKC